MAEGNIGLAEPSTITKSLRSVTQDINSSVVHQEVMTIGGAVSSLSLAAVIATQPGSTTYGLVTRQAPYVLSHVVNSTVLATRPPGSPRVPLERHTST